jgi:CubicO group peptidase (beta-lactamase class C family)
MKHTSLIAFLLLQCSMLFAQPSDAYIQSQLNAGKMPGATMVIIKDGHWIYDRCFGESDIVQNRSASRETAFLTSSVSNAFIATAIMQLWEKGAVGLDDNVDLYLPFHLYNPVFPADDITVRMLLAHTSSIKDNWSVLIPLFTNGDSPIRLDTFMRNYFTPGGTYYSSVNNFHNYKPGIGWNYANENMALAAYIVERITGDNFSHYCDTAIFDKLCMSNTSYLLSGVADTTTIARPYSWTSSGYFDNGLYGIPDYPDGQLRTNIVSLARFMTMYMQNGIYEGSRILDSSTVSYMMQQHATAIPFSQGIVFYTRQSGNLDTLWGQEGRIMGASAAMYFNYAKKTGVVVLANGEGSAAANIINILDTLYQYGTTVTPSINDTFPKCAGTTSVATVKDENEIRIFPNPITSNFTIEVNEPGVFILMDMRGKIRARHRLQTAHNELQMGEEIVPGVYFAYFYDRYERLISVRKLVKIN